MLTATQGALPRGAAETSPLDMPHGCGVAKSSVFGGLHHEYPPGEEHGIAPNYSAGQGFSSEESLRRKSLIEIASVRFLHGPHQGEADYSVQDDVVRWREWLSQCFDKQSRDERRGSSG